MSEDVLVRWASIEAWARDEHNIDPWRREWHHAIRAYTDEIRCLRKSVAQRDADVEALRAECEALREALQRLESRLWQHDYRPGALQSTESVICSICGHRRGSGHAADCPFAALGEGDDDD